jgi:hypothetical protein
VSSWPATVAEAANALAARETRPAGAEIADALRRLPTPGSLVGVAHGDPELDNVIRDAQGDPNSSTSRMFRSRGSPRIFASHCETSSIARRGPVLQSSRRYIDGYRERRPLSDHELTWLPLFRRAHAVVTLAGLERVLAERATDDWPVWRSSCTPACRTLPLDSERCWPSNGMHAGGAPTALQHPH